MDTNDFKFRQGYVASLLGIPMSEIRARKKNLAEGVDWVRSGNNVLFCDAGVKKMRAGLNLAASPAQEASLPLALPAAMVAPVVPDEAPAKKTPPPARGSDSPRRVFCLPDAPPSPEQVRVLVVHQRVANPQILEAHRPGADATDRSQVVRVRVRSSANFVRGMVLEVRLVQLPDLFEFTGRLPRWLGKY